MNDCNEIKDIASSLDVTHLLVVPNFMEKLVSMATSQSLDSRYKCSISL